MRCPNCGANLVRCGVVVHDDHYHRNWLCLCGVDVFDTFQFPKEY